MERMAGKRVLVVGDLMLDAPHHNAMTSACDALRMGLPLLTVPGRAMAARASEGMLRAAGLPELVAANHDEYVRIAVELGTNPAATEGFKRRLARNRTTAPLFDTVGRVRALEAALLGMAERLGRGARPESFEV